MDCQYHSERRYEMSPLESSWQASFGHWFSAMLVDTMTTQNRLRHVALFKQGTEENVERSTTDAQGNRGIQRVKQRDHRDQVTNPATVRSHVCFHPGPGISPQLPAANTPVVGRDSPPQTASTISSKDTRWTRGKQCWRASCGQYLPGCWLTKGLCETDEPSTIQCRAPS